MDILHTTLISQQRNSTFIDDVREYLPDSTSARGIYDIVSTCVSTVFVCVWSALHMNIPTRDRGFAKTKLMKLGWVALGLLMPDLLLLIAVCELASAIILLRKAYIHIPDFPSPPRGWLYRRVLLRGITFNSSYEVSTP